MVMGHIVKLRTLLHFDLRNMESVCVGPRCLCRTAEGTPLWSLHVTGPIGIVTPQYSCCAGVLQGQWPLSSQSLSFVNAEVGLG